MTIFLWIVKIVQLVADGVMALVLVLQIESGQKLLVFTTAVVVTMAGSLTLDVIGRSLQAGDPLVDPMHRFLSGFYDPFVTLVLGIVVLVLLYVPLGLPAAAIAIAAWIFVAYEVLTDVLTAIFVR